MTQIEIWLRLVQVNELYGDEIVRVVHRLNTQSCTNSAVLLQTGFSPRQARCFLTFSDLTLEKTLRWLEQPNHHFVVTDSEHCPLQLRMIEDYPGELFVAGVPACLHSFQVAIVGSRQYSWYGECWGRLFCEKLAACGVMITSGLARGIDDVAHNAAINRQGTSIAVLGDGLGAIHPWQHTRLAERLIEAGGALVSEFPLDILPSSHNFPRRNCIISGLSRGILAAEAAQCSGSLVTICCAVEQGREVFALPGPIGSPGSESPHWLIQQGTILVTTPEEILESLQYGLQWLPGEPEKSICSLDHEEVALPFPEPLADVGDGVTPVDVVAERAGQPVPEVVARLLELELAGWIAVVSGGYV